MKTNRIRSSLLALSVIAATLLVCGTGGSFRAQASTGRALPYATTITVTSTTDPDNSDSRTCLTHTPPVRCAGRSSRRAACLLLRNPP